MSENKVVSIFKNGDCGDLVIEITKVLKHITTIRETFSFNLRTRSVVIAAVEESQTCIDKLLKKMSTGIDELDRTKHTEYSFYMISSLFGLHCDAISVLLTDKHKEEPYWKITVAAHLSELKNVLIVFSKMIGVKMK